MAAVCKYLKVQWGKQMRDEIHDKIRPNKRLKNRLQTGRKERKRESLMEEAAFQEEL